jgi:acetyl-CoA/propionyl-CoA carboxylase biotin carboxyl carrier protein
VTTFTVPTGPGIRVDAGIRAGDEVAPQFDSLLAKLIVTGADRPQALRRARRALAEFDISGLPTVLSFHRAVVDLPAFTGPDRLGVHTSWIETEFAEHLSADPSLAPVAAPTHRRTITIELDGRRMALGVPENLLAGLAGGGGAAPQPMSEQTDPAELHSTMAGTVVKWLVDDGATVAEGEPLLVLEAMKMESTVVAHRSGTVSGLLVAAGTGVAVNAVLARIDT